MDESQINNNLEAKKENIKIKIKAGEKAVIIFMVFILIFTVFILIFTLKSLFYPSTTTAVSTNTPSMGQGLSRMALTSYDKELALKMMDKDGDGKCDACGMPIEMCMDSGMIQCNMDPESTIGVLGSQHIHADWKVYINGEPLDFTDKAHMDRMRNNLPVSSFIHVDSGAPAPEKTGDILHMHATGVPLWIFFESTGLNIPESTKVYVNGKLNSDGLNYMFNDLDKILITDGKGGLQEQLNIITDFAKIH